MKKNVASQLISAQMIDSSDGSDKTTGTCNVAVEKDGVAGTGGTATHIANGKWEFAPIQGDTNGDHLTFQFVITGAITVTVQVYTGFPQTVDNDVLNQSVDGKVDLAQLDLDTITDSDGVILGAAGVDLIWDEEVTTSAHNGANSAGKRLRNASALLQTEGTVSDVSPAVGGFDTDLTEANAFWDDSLIVFEDGALAGQARPIGTFVNASGAMTFDEDWTSAPANGDAFIIYSTHIHPISQIADGIWDELLTGGTHNINNSAGKRLRQASDSAVVATGTCQASGSHTVTEIVLDAAESAVDNVFIGKRLLIVAGTNIGFEGIVVDYDGTTKIASITPGFPAVCDNTSEYDLIPAMSFGAVSLQGHTENAVIIDTNNGSAGTTPQANGTEENPVDTIADAITIAAAITPVASKHFKQRKGSSITLAQTFSSYLFDGRGGTIALGGQDVGFCTFLSQNLSGIAVNTNRVFISNCLLTGVTMGAASINDSSLAGTFTVNQAGSYSFNGCRAQSVASPPTLDMGDAIANTDVMMADWDGPLTISELGSSGTDILTISGQGAITLDASCIGGTINIYGAFSVTNNGSGITINYDDNTASITLIEADTDELQGAQGDWATATGFATEAKQDAQDIILAKIPLSDGVLTHNATAATSIADAFLNRDMSAVSDTNDRSPLNALRFLRNKWSVSGGTLTVTKEDDSTSAWTATVTTNAAADPVTGSDPA